MTRRKRLQPRRLTAQLLEANAEMVAVAWRGWWVEEQSASPLWWQSIAAVHGDRLLEKWVAAAPGTRPAFVWVNDLGGMPVEREPGTEEMASRKWIEIGRRRHWFAGEPWQRSEGELLSEMGVVDGAELRRHRKWVRAGCPLDYRLDEGWHASWLFHG